jgi:hypothetical protein
VETSKVKIGGNMSDEAKKEEKSADTKTEKKVEKKEKAPKEVKKVNVQSVKANAKTNINPSTGTRFQAGSARQLGFDIVLKGTKEGKNVKEIREILKNTRKETGAAFNMDIGYVNFVVASHPDFFEVFTDGSIKILKEPKPDLEAAKKLENERDEKRKKALAAREERKTKAKDEKKDEKPSVKKDEKKDEKSEKKHEKPTKKEE